MIPIVISARAFEKNINACLARIIDVTHHASSCPQAFCPQGVLLDINSLDVSRLQGDPNPTDKNTTCIESTIEFMHINVADWIDISQQPLHAVINFQARKLCSNTIIVLDARHYEADVISAVLHKITYTWFHLESWQPAFALIVNDFDCLRFVNELFATFYIQPLSTTKKNIQLDIRTMRAHIWALRWLGLGHLARFSKHVYFNLQRWKKYVKRRLLG